LSELVTTAVASDLSLLDGLRAAVREAGLLALDYYNAQRSNSSWRKDDGSAVSEADIAVDQMLRERLLTLRPDFGWLSEETADAPARLDKSHLFIVDPIDGTRAFLGKRPHWVVSAAVAIDGDVAMGLLYNPVADELFEASRGQGATLNGAPIRVGQRRELEGSTIIASPGRFSGRLWREPWPMVATFMVNSVAYRLALVAANRADAVLTLSGKHEWDMAAASLLLQEAGGIVTDHCGEELRFNRPQPSCGSVLGANPALHAAMLARTRLVEPARLRRFAND
jgi:myo-inositol-1(or 4)-monophosphatase